MTRYCLVGMAILTMQTTVSAQWTPSLAAHPQQGRTDVAPPPPVPAPPLEPREHPPSFPEVPPLSPYAHEGAFPIADHPLPGEYDNLPGWTPGYGMDGGQGDFACGCVQQAPCMSFSAMSPYCLAQSPPPAMTPLMIRGNPYGYEPAVPRGSVPSVQINTLLAHKVWETHGRQLRRDAKHDKSPGNMLPMEPLYPVAHGSYYFRPYNYRMIPFQQAQAFRWTDRIDQPYTRPLMDDLMNQAARFHTGMSASEGTSIFTSPHGMHSPAPMPLGAGVPSVSEPLPSWSRPPSPAQHFRPVQRPGEF